MNAFAEIACSLVVSAYKGLTSTLLSAQQNYALRPYFNAKIIDDTVQPNQVISTSLPPLGNGSAATAPDGTVCAVGLDTSGNVTFYKGANLHSGAWDSSKIIEAAGGTFNQSFNNYSIAISDYYNGSYAILITYYENLVNDPAQQIFAKGWLSTDGGVSFTWVGSFSTGTTASRYFVAPALNLSIASMKPRLVGNVLKFGWFVIRPTTSVMITPSQQCYEIAYAYGDQVNGINGLFSWGKRYVESQDWTLHSLTTYFLNGIDYVVFSGYRNFIDTPNLQISGNTSILISQYGLWLTGIEQLQDSNNDFDDSQTGDVWLLPQPIFNSIAIGNTNFNSFTYPVATIINGLVNISFFALIVDSVISQTLGDINRQYSYMLIQSVDGEAFTYPQPFVMTDGSELSGNVSNIVGSSYTDQGNYRYAISNGKVWEYAQNNIVADITNDVVNYTIVETAGQPSSISLKLANQNNQWVGSSPTNPGAAAIAGNRKVVFQQGYYNADGVPETVPRNVYFIDDIQQSVSNIANDVTITGRDLYKRMKTLITRWAFNWFGPFFYVDNFDGTTLGNWNQQSSGWVENGNTLTTTTAPGADSNILLANIPRVTESSMMGVGILGKTTGNAYVYAYYFDSNNWLRLNYNFASTPHAKVEKCVNGSITSLSSTNSSLIPNGETHMVWVRQYDYYKFAFYISAVSTGNTLGAYNTGNLLGTGEYNLSANIIGMQSQQWGVGVGANGVIPVFNNFQYSQFNVSNNVQEIVQRLATKAGIFSYDFQKTFKDNFFVPSNWYPGGDTITNNRVLTIQGVYSTYTSIFKTDQIVADGEVSFTAKCIPQSGNTNNQFYFYFRTDSYNNPSAAYRLHVRSSGKAMNVGFERLYNGTWYNFPSSQSFVGTDKGGLNFDITKIHTYRVVFVSGWMYAFIDNIMVAAWNDDNTTSPYLTSGYIGFGTFNTNEVLMIFGVSATAFWKQSPTFSLNPGDDIESAVLSAIKTVRGWIFSDMFGSLKAVLLNSNDASTYTYQNQLYQAGVDTSDKEYVSEVVVYGNGVSATARNTQLMAGVATRVEVVVDYTITTQQDAKNRADFELTNSNQYRSQLNPKQAMNVGAELFDAVQVVSTGNNNVGIDSTTRTYAQKFTTGGTNNEFSLEIDTGNL